MLRFALSILHCTFKVFSSAKLELTSLILGKIWFTLIFWGHCAEVYLIAIGAPLLEFTCTFNGPHMNKNYTVKSLLYQMEQKFCKSKRLNHDVPVIRPTTLETALPTAAAAAPSVVALLPSPCAGWGPVYSAHWRQTDFGDLQCIMWTKIQMYQTHQIVSFGWWFCIKASM